LLVGRSQPNLSKTRHAVLLNNKTQRKEHKESKDLRRLIQDYVGVAYPFDNTPSAPNGGRPE